MKNFIERARKKLPKMTREQVESLLHYASSEIDRLETVIDSLDDGILVCDGKHRLVLSNKSAGRFLPIAGFERGALPVWRAVRDGSVAEFLEQTLKAGDRVSGREFTLENQGLRRTLSFFVLPLVKEHRVTGAVVVIEDVTEKRRREARFRQAENLASLTTLAAGVAHEIKNPLGSLSIHIQLIQKTLAMKKETYVRAVRDLIKKEKNAELPDPEDDFATMKRYLDVVNEEVARLNMIVVDFLFAVRPMNLEPEEGSINTLIEELVKFVRFELAQAGISTVLELDPALPPILFDERYMKQALLNLIKNAIAAMEGGGVLTIATRSADNDVQIEIRDTGAGIPEENLPKIFEPYFTTKENGTGLGLTLVFKIIKEHHGEISVSSKSGEGTVFVVTLPGLSRDARMLSYQSPAMPPAMPPV